jgi:hypothetical protein
MPPESPGLRSPQEGTDSEARFIPSFPESELPDLEPVSDDDQNECSWDGGVNHTLSDSEADWKSTENSDDEGADSDSGLSELEGPDLVESLKNQLEQEIAALSHATPYERIKAPISSTHWKKTESNHGLGYTRNSDRTRHQRQKDVRDAVEHKAESIKL